MSLGFKIYDLYLQICHQPVYSTIWIKIALEKQWYLALLKYRGKKQNQGKTSKNQKKNFYRNFCIFSSHYYFLSEVLKCLFSFTAEGHLQEYAKYFNETRKLYNAHTYARLLN